MKRWHILAVGLSLAIVLFSVAGFFFPSSYTIERGISIDAPTDSVFAVINDLNTWPDWSPWQKSADPTLQYTFSGAPGVAGSKLTWQGENVGTGEIVLTQASAADGVGYQIAADGTVVANGKLHFLDKGTNRTRVGITYTAELGWNPMQRFAGLFAEGQLNPQFDEALKRLKATVEP